MDVVAVAVGRRLGRVAQVSARAELKHPNPTDDQPKPPNTNQTGKKKQYAVSFGVELVALNTAASYFHERLAIPALTAGKMIDNMCMFNHR